jgi:hypothetical protein
LIITLKGEPLPKYFCRRGLQWQGLLHLLIFCTEVIKFYWLMLLYPGELYRLLGASSSVFIFLSKEPVCPHRNRKYIPEHHWCMAIFFPVIAETHTIGTHLLIGSSSDINFMVLIKDNISLVTKINWRPLILYVECNFLWQNPGLLSRFTGEIVIFFEITWCLYQY